MVPTALTPSITSPGTNGGIIEYVAPFPDVTVTVGAEHNTCVITTKSLDLTCTTGIIHLRKTRVCGYIIECNWWRRGINHNRRI